MNLEATFLGILPKNQNRLHLKKRGPTGNPNEMHHPTLGLVFSLRKNANRPENASLQTGKINLLRWVFQFHVFPRLRQ